MHCLTCGQELVQLHNSVIHHEQEHFEVTLKIEEYDRHQGRRNGNNLLRTIDGKELVFCNKTHFLEWIRQQL